MTAVKQTGRAVPMPAGLLTGILSSLALTLAGAATIAKLMDMEIMKQQQTGYAVMVLLIAASWLGSWVSFRKIKRQKVRVCLMSGICFYGILLMMTALFFGGQYDGAGETALLVLCGSLLAILLKFHEGNGRKRRHVKIRNR